MSAINPAAMTAQQLVTVLNKAGAKLSAEDLRRDLAAGAPQNADGTIHLVHYTAWLVSQVE